MTTMQVKGAAVELNNQGFLSDFHNWNKDIAMAIAEEEGLELTDCHWEVIQFMRDYFEQNETPPSPKLIVAACGEKITGMIRCRNKDLHALFPTGGCKIACRLAGLPRHYCHAC